MIWNFMSKNPTVQFAQEEKNEKFGKRNGISIFEQLEENMKLLREENVIKIEYQIYDKENQSSLAIAMVTPAMARVHSKVII